MVFLCSYYVRARFTVRGALIHKAVFCSSREHNTPRRAAHVASRHVRWPRGGAGDTAPAGRDRTRTRRAEQADTTALNSTSHYVQISEIPDRSRSGTDIRRSFLARRSPMRTRMRCRASQREPSLSVVSGSVSLWLRSRASPVSHGRLTQNVSCAAREASDRRHTHEAAAGAAAGASVDVLRVVARHGRPTVCMRSRAQMTSHPWQLP